MVEIRRGWERLQILGEMVSFAERAVVLRLKKEHPDLSNEKIQAKVAGWYLTRPGAELGDCDGPFRVRRRE